MDAPTVDPRYGCVRAGGELMTGLNVALRTAFFPQYSYAAATLGPLGPASDPAVQHDAMPKNPKCRGRLIDRTVNKMTQLCARGAPLADLIGDAPLTGPLAAEVRGFRRACVDYVSAQLIPYLIEHALTPVEAQAPVADRSARVGTTIDLVCRDAAGRFVILENKLGFDAYYFRHTDAAMASPFEFLDDSPHSQHQLYLAFAVSMFERNRGVTVNRGECAVLRMAHAGLAVHPLANWPLRRTRMARAWGILARQRTWIHRDHVAFVRKRRKKAS